MKGVLICVLLGLPIASALQATEPQRPLSASELLSVEQICVRLVGIPASKSKHLRQTLRPYVRDKAEFDSRIILCSGECVDEVHLRGGLLLSIVSDNAPPGYPGYAKDSLVDSATVVPEPKSKKVRGGSSVRVDAKKVFGVLRTSDDPQKVYVIVSRKEFLSRKP